VKFKKEVCWRKKRYNKIYNS